MPVNTQHKQYVAFIRKWQRCRDCYDGSDAVKDKGTLYLPALDSHLTGNTLGSSVQKLVSPAYDAYVKRALFFNATGRTVTALAGAIFQKEPTVQLPKAIQDDASDVTLSGVSAASYGLDVVTEIWKTGRVGGLVDMVKGGGRPYWTTYLAENIVSWRGARDPETGAFRTVLVVLKECRDEDDATDPFAPKETEQYRVLQLIDGAYVQTIWRKPENSDKWEQVEQLVPTRREKPLTFIPFVFFGPTSLDPAVQKPPVLDLVDVNLSHYRTSADLEHARHWCALPTPWVAGVAGGDKAGPLHIGSSKAWVLDKDGKAGMLEVQGSGMQLLQSADQDKRKMMAVLGARLLEEQPDVEDTATGTLMRHGGEHATLRTVTQTAEEGLTLLARYHAWWLGTKENPQDEKDTVIELNKDFLVTPMSSADLTALVGAVQGGMMSYETFYYNISKGEYARPGVTAAQELREIQEQELPSAPGAADTPPGPEVKDGGPGVEPGDVVEQDEGPYKLIKRGDKYLVIKADTGEIVPGGDHGKDKKKAAAHLAALHTNVKDA